MPSAVPAAAAAGTRTTLSFGTTLLRTPTATAAPSTPMKTTCRARPSGGQISEVTTWTMVSANGGTTMSVSERITMSALVLPRATKNSAVRARASKRGCTTPKAQSTARCAPARGGDGHRGPAAPAAPSPSASSRSRPTPARLRSARSDVDTASAVSRSVVGEARYAACTGWPVRRIRSSRRGRVHQSLRLTATAAMPARRAAGPCCRLRVEMASCRRPSIPTGTPPGGGATAAASYARVRPR
jgi:hypothetical protein